MGITEWTYRFDVDKEGMTLNLNRPPRDEVSMELSEGEYILTITKVEKEEEDDEN